MWIRGLLSVCSSCYCRDTSAKILLLSEKFPEILASTHSLLLSKLIQLYFCSKSQEHERLKQCLSVFFEHYPSLSVNQQKGINANVKRSPVVVANMRKRAVQASRLILQVMQAALYRKGNVPKDGNGSEDTEDVFVQFESGEEGLALRIAAEVLGFHTVKTAAEKSYISVLCRILVLLHFRLSEQGPITLIRQLLNRVAQCVVADKDFVGELREMAARLKGSR